MTDTCFKSHTNTIYNKLHNTQITFQQLCKAKTEAKLRKIKNTVNSSKINTFPSK